MTKEELDKLRIHHPIVNDIPEYSCSDQYGYYSTGAYKWKGKLIIVAMEDGKLHLSVSCKHTLGYMELKEIRYTFLPDDKRIAQIFPSRDEFINLHEYCFHLYEI